MAVEILTDKDFELLIKTLVHDLEKLVTITSRVLKRLIEGSLSLDNPRHRSLVQSSCYAMERSKRMIADLNDAIADKKLNVSIKSCNLYELIMQTADNFAPMAENENIVFQRDIDEIDAVIQTDGDLITRIIENYLYNAISHTEAGGFIRLALKTGRQDGDGSYFISVENSGSSIPAGELENIFNAGVQLSLKQKRYWRGSGLGLAFCKMAADAVGAEVGALNLSENRGVLFYCRS